MTFEALQKRLIWFVNNRISNGDFSERALARILRISQSQIHNVLKGARKLTPELADRILRCFQMSVLDLLEAEDLTARLAATDSNRSNASGLLSPIASHVPVQRFAPGADIMRKAPQGARQVPKNLSEKSA